MKRPSRPLARWLLASAIALGAIAAVLVWNSSDQQPPGMRDLERKDLDLRHGVLFVPGESNPFDGRLIENYPAGGRKLVIDVRAGRLHGHSRGWYPSGQMEIDEQFVGGVSHGQRTRWYANGNRKSLAEIEHGKVAGPFIEWHENGQKAVEMTLRNGQPDGLVQAWHASGARKSQLRYAEGRQVAKQFWKDPAGEVGLASVAK